MDKETEESFTIRPRVSGPQARLLPSQREDPLENIMSVMWSGKVMMTMMCIH